MTYNLYVFMKDESSDGSSFTKDKRRKVYLLPPCNFIAAHSFRIIEIKILHAHLTMMTCLR